MLTIAASLTSMVNGYTEPEEHQRTELTDLRALTHSLREAALELADEDASVGQAFGAAFRLELGPRAQDCRLPGIR